jgi:hypothetical protein
MRATEFITEQGVAEDRENFNGINLLLQKDDEELFVKASAGSRELGHVLFVIDGDYLMPQDLEVDERFRGQGIAQTMYDYVKSKGYKIRRSGQQTDAGAGFWDKHRTAQNVWEQGDSEVKSHDFMAGHCHVMALALKQLHPDWQIRAHVGYDDDAADDTEYRVDHVYTVAPDGTAYDCRGKFSNEEQLVGPDATGGVDTQYVNFGPEEIKQAMLRGELKKFTKQDLANAMQVGKQVVAEGSEQINEYRDRLLQYVKSLLPTWPEYVLKDWLVPNKGNFSNLPADALKNSVMEKVQGAGLTPNSKWQLVPDMKFTMDMFDPKTKQLLIGRAGGSSDLGMGIPKDKERHATQAALAQQQGGVRKEPVLLIKTAKGYELLEGWHRTIQHFVKYPEGYTGPAYVVVAQGQQGVAEGSDLGYNVIVRGNNFSYRGLQDALTDGHPNQAKVYKNGKLLGTIGSLSQLP